MTSETDFIRIAVPFFFALIALEYLWSLKKGKSVYTIADTFSNLACGTLQQVVGLSIKVAFIFLYDWFLNHFSLQSLLGVGPWPMAWWGWCIAFILIDFVYYWFHRLSHGINFMWAAHSVHHQSEEYNLSVALRQSSLQNIFNFTFFLSLAFVGIPTQMVIICYSINLIYQFWIHTRLLGKLGPLEYIFNTPSHHRVHHGVNLKYLDRNHAGVFIVWDRWFGSFQEEDEEVVYGVTVPLKSWNPVWLQMQPYYALLKDSVRTREIMDKVKVWLTPPGWRPRDLGGFSHPRAITPSQQVKYKTSSAKWTLAYVTLQFIVLLLLSLAVEPLFEKDSIGLVVVLTASIVVGAASLAGVLERRRWAWPTEVGRLLVLAMTAVSMYQI